MPTPWLSNLDHLTKTKSYPIVDQWAPKHLFRLLISGSSGSGKTNLALGLILEKLYYDKLYLYAKSLEQAKWQYLIEKIQEICEQKGINKDDVLCATDDVNQIKQLEELDKEKVNLVVFDDLLLDQSPLILKYFTQARHRNASLMFLSQNYYSTNKLIRTNCSHFCLFNTNMRNLQLIAHDLAGSVDHERFIKEFKTIMKADPFGYMVLDLLNIDKALRIRNGWDKPIVIEE